MDGWMVGKSEQWIPNPKMPGGGFRKDLFGIIDMVCVHPEYGIMGVQSTGTDWSGHVKKIERELEGDNLEAIKMWLGYSTLELWAWRKLKFGEEKYYTPRIGNVVYDREHDVLRVVERCSDDSMVLR